MRPIDFEKDPVLESGEVAVALTKDEVVLVLSALNLSINILETIGSSSDPSEVAVDMGVLRNQINNTGFYPIQF